MYRPTPTPRTLAPRTRTRTLAPRTRTLAPRTRTGTAAPRCALRGRLGARVASLAPGLALCAVVAGLALAVALVLPTISALLVAIVVGVVVRNTVRLPASLEPGIAFAAKPLLRLGIVLLGLQLVVGDILALGPGMVVVVIAIVVGGIAATLLIGKWLGIGATQRLLIACGFSICGAAAVAAVDGVVDADEEEVVTAVALVVIFGTLMIPIVPFVAGLIGLTPYEAGMWAGGSVHEVAQVVAIGGTLGGTALGVAVVVKLARVLMLAPVMAVIGLQRRRALAKTGEDASGARGGTLPPLVPLFVIGFVVMVAIRSFGLVPQEVVAGAGVAQTVLLAAAMFALGTGVRFGMFRRVGVKPFALAGASTLVVAGIALGGVLLVG